jgi:hypothetical protein
MDNPYQTLSIASAGLPTLPRPDKTFISKRDFNDIRDIEGAFPKPRPCYSNKPLFLNSEIEGAAPKQLIRSRNVRDNSLYIDDIEGTRHTIKDRMMRTTRHVNPLDPIYKVPAFTPCEAEFPKFIRDPLQLSDIDGSRTKAKKLFATRNILDISDIGDSHSRTGTRYCSCSLLTLLTLFI